MSPSWEYIAMNALANFFTRLVMRWRKAYLNGKREI